MVSIATDVGRASITCCLGEKKGGKGYLCPDMAKSTVERHAGILAGCVKREGFTWNTQAGFLGLCLICFRWTCCISGPEHRSQLL